MGQNIQNEISLERSIFAYVVAYQFNNLRWKLNGPGKGYASLQMERKRPKQSSSKGSFAFGPERYRTFRPKGPRLLKWFVMYLEHWAENEMTNTWISYMKK